MTAEYPTPDLTDIELIDVLRALADPVRLEVVRRLASGAPRQKSATFMNLGVQKATLSYHLRTLREAGLTSTLVDGRIHWVELRRDEVEEWFPGLLGSLVADRSVHPRRTPKG